MISYLFDFKIFQNRKHEVVKMTNITRHPLVCPSDKTLRFTTDGVSLLKVKCNSRDRWEGNCMSVQLEN